MHLADHIRPLLRDHDCVIIPDFGGLVADVSSARAQPGRQVLSAPTKLVAFNQALTRNDGLLVDALSEHLGLTIAQAREAVRHAVAGLQQELDDTNRTELPGIGIFRRAVGRGLSFEYTGTDNLLASAFGLPELAACPVRTTDIRTKRPQPALRGTATRRTRLARLLPGGAIAVVAGLLLLLNYQGALQSGYLPASWQSQSSQANEGNSQLVAANSVAEPQQATLGQHDFDSPPIVSEGITPLNAGPDEAKPVLAAEAALNQDSVEVPAVRHPAATERAAPRKSVLASTPLVAVPRTKVLAPVAKSVARAPKAPAVPVTSTIKTRTGRYYVIAGAYSTLAHAEQGRKVLAHTGHEARVILPPFGSRLFRLTAADYPDLASAQREAQRLRVSTHCDYNTLKF